MTLPVHFIGGLPTGYRFYRFSSLYIRQLCLADMPMIEAIRNMHRPSDVFLLLRNVCVGLDDIDILSITLDEIGYVFSYIRKLSYTDAPITSTWDCLAQVISDIDDPRNIVLGKFELGKQELAAQNLERRTCGRKNTQLLYPYMYSYIIPSVDWSSYYADVGTTYSLPTLHDAIVLDDMEDLNEWPSLSQFRNLLLWLNGKTVQEKLDQFKSLGESIAEENAYSFALRDKYKHSVSLSYKLLCGDCGHSPTVTKELDGFNSLPVVSSDSVMNMQYTLMGKLHCTLGEDTPLQKLLYWHSAYQKDKQDKIAAARMKKAQRRPRGD